MEALVEAVAMRHDSVAAQALLVLTFEDILCSELGNKSCSEELSVAINTTLLRYKKGDDLSL